MTQWVIGNPKWGTLRSRHGSVLILIKFVCFMVNVVSILIKCVFIIVKIKYMNFDRINDICDKVNFIIKLPIFYNTWQIFYQHTQYFFKTHTNITIFDTFDGFWQVWHWALGFSMVVVVLQLCRCEVMVFAGGSVLVW